MNPEWLIGSGITAIVWLVRLEAKILQSEKEILNIKEDQSQAIKELLNEVKELRKEFHAMDKNVAQVMERVEHLNMLNRQL